MHPAKQIIAVPKVNTCIYFIGPFKSWGIRCSDFSVAESIAAVSQKITDYLTDVVPPDDPFHASMESITNIEKMIMLIYMDKFNQNVVYGGARTEQAYTPVYIYQQSIVAPVHSRRNLE
jgi:hypothetical protein